MKVSVIFSAHRTENTPAQNAEAHKTLLTELSHMGFEYVECEGKFEGYCETSVTVPTTSKSINQLMWVADCFNQDCILVVEYESRNAHFLPLDREPVLGEPNGTWVRITEEEAKANGDFTCYTSGNIFYTVK